MRNKYGRSQHCKDLRSRSGLFIIRKIGTMDVWEDEKMLIKREAIISNGLNFIATINIGYNIKIRYVFPKRWHIRMSGKKYWKIQRKSLSSYHREEVIGQFFLTLVLGKRDLSKDFLCLFGDGNQTNRQTNTLNWLHVSLAINTRQNFSRNWRVMVEML